MGTLRSIVFSSVIAGIVVGLLVTFAHQLGTVPLILEAETYEQNGVAAPAAPAGHAHDATALAHEHDEEAWMPAEGMQRNLFTALGDVVTAIGFALLLSSAYVLTGRRVTWREGVFWGLAGFAVFTLAPSLGLPPELPGMPASDVGPRQLWWIGTAAATAAGLGLLAFKRTPLAVIAAIVLITAPHLIGAPAQPEQATAVPHGMLRDFVVAVTLTSFLFWVALGGLTGALHQRFARG
jgi:cobalt transporter subunit CbtA